MTATKTPAQDVSDAAIADTLDQIAQSINTSALDDVIAVLRARELQQAQCPNCLNDGCHCATCNPFPGELQQPLTPGDAEAVAWLLDSDDARDRRATTCSEVAATWREAGFTVVELTRISR